MPRFVGRESELSRLADAYRSGRSEFIPIYGRRRVGKSELILKFLEDRPGIYFVGQRSSAALQVREFLEAAARALRMPLLARVQAEDLVSALVTAAEEWAASNPRRKLVLALDEFQWTAESDPGIVPALQRVWDRRWRDSGQIVLILCGSYLGFMEREILGAGSPLFGRRTAQIHLRPFGFLEAARFHPRWSPDDRARGYFLVGGLPQYLLCLDDRRSIAENIRDHLLLEFAPLRQEPTFLLREEVREIGPYQAILAVIAAGRGSVREIASGTGIAERSVHYYLNQLIELGYLRRRRPLDGGRPSLREVRFALDDALLAFWFRFVFPNTSLLRSQGPAGAYRDRVAPALDAWFGGRFELLCREALPRLYAREGVGAGFRIGEYWSADTQIDVVGVRDDHWIDLGECKWGAVRSPKALEAELERKIAHYPNRPGSSLGRRFFTRRKPEARADAPNWYSLEDLYSPDLG